MAVGDLIIRGIAGWRRLASPNDATKFLDGTGAYTIPAGTGVASVTGASGVASSGGANPNLTLANGIGVLNYISVSLSMAQMNVANVTSVQVIPAPGAGNRIDLISCTANRRMVTAASASGGNATLFYHGVSAVPLCTSFSPALNTGADVGWFKVGVVVPTANTNITGDNLAVDFGLTVGSAGGSGTIVLKILYLIVPVP